MGLTSVGQTVVESILMEDLTTPIFAIDGDDIRVFPTPREVERMIEPIDVERGDTLFFDARGRALRVTVASGRRYSFIPEAAATAGPDDLASRLRTYFAELPARFDEIKQRATASCSLVELVPLFLELEGGTVARRRKRGTGR